MSRVGEGLGREQDTTPEVERNFNDLVRIVVTPAGEHIWNERQEEIREQVAGWAQAYEVKPLVREEDGSTMMQLWEVMVIFGSHMGMGKRTDEYPIKHDFRFTY
jgi:hypothetical protein